MAQKKSSSSTKTTSKTSELKEEKEKETCFTIMPFGGWFDQYYLTIFHPAITDAGLKPERADDLFRPSTIVNDIWDYTKNARIILADLTGKNPNVFYELGLAHALAKPAIIIAESIEDVPFDLRALRLIEYDKNAPDWGEKLRKKITSSLRETLKSPLESVLPTFLDVKGQTSTPAVTKHEKEILELKQDFELLRRQLGSISKERGVTTEPSYTTRYNAQEFAQEFVKDHRDKGYGMAQIYETLISLGYNRDFIKLAIQRYYDEVGTSDVKSQNEE